MREALIVQLRIHLEMSHLYHAEGFPLNNGVAQLVVTCWHITSNYNYTVKLYYFTVCTVQNVERRQRAKGRERNLFMKYVLNRTLKRLNASEIM